MMFSNHGACEAPFRIVVLLVNGTTEQLKQQEIQLEFRRLAKDIDYVLAGIELMNAFPGHCSLCPV